MSETSDVYTVIDVAYNPDVLQAAEKDQVKKDQLIRMAMKCIEEQFQFTLSHFYHITKFKIKGSIQRMKQNLMRIQTDHRDLRENMRKELTLEQIRSSSVNNPDHFPQLLLQRDQVSDKKGCLIEEISSTEIQVDMEQPAYELKIVADQNKKPLKIELKVELPGINSVSLCDLNVSQDDLLIEVSEKYRLHLNLPESVNTEMTTAKFIKEKATLIVTMPLVEKGREGETSVCETSIGGDWLPLTHPQLGTLSLTQAGNQPDCPSVLQDNAQATKLYQSGLKT
ncbi:PIH1 domain-containing protein 2 isoform X3 [Artibeus jamaicensis]|nr:PIH1 domain-containing protein 2 isoform X3 [Artibeus jamaicensis]